jgi:hypothetical protein
MAKRATPPSEPEQSLLERLLADAGQTAATVDDDAFADLTPGEIATGTVSMVPLPMMAMLEMNDKLSALWVAIDPELSTAEVDKGLGRYEDLLISTLAAVRANRRSLTDGADASGLAARASVKCADAACAIIDMALDEEDPLVLFGLDDATLKANRKTLKSRC